MKTAKIIDEVYCCKLIVIVCKDYEDFRKYFHRYYKARGKDIIPSEYEEGVAGEYWVKNHNRDKEKYSQTHMIWLRDFKKKPHEIAILSHELMHYVAHVMGDKGLELSPKTDEAYAYYYESMLRRILEKLWN